MADHLSTFVPVADAIAALLRPHAEVVIHDLATGTIRHIANRLSRREPGDASLTDADGVITLEQPVIGPYAKKNGDGRSLKSVTAVVRDGRRKPVGLLCINLDVSMFEALHSVSREFLRFADTSERPPALFHGDWREEINEVVGQFLVDRGTTLAAMNLADREAVVAALESRGLFDVRNAVAYITQLLGLSRATLYKTLKVVRAG